MRVASLVLVGLLAAPPLGAQLPAGVTPAIYCPPLAPACFAMATALLPGASPLTSIFRVTLQNLQGSYAPNGAGWFGLAGFWIDRRSGPEAWYLGAGHVVARAVGNAQLFRPYDGGFETSGDQFTDTSRGLFFGDPTDLGQIGCTALDGGPVPNGYFARTCPSEGIDGWIQYDITMMFAGTGSPVPVDRAPTLDDFAFSVMGAPGGALCTWAGAASGVAAGTVGPVCAAQPYALAASTTPEPATLALLAPALLGLGMARRRVKHGHAN